MHMWVWGACGLATCGAKKLGLTIVKEEALGWTLVGGNLMVDKEIVSCGGQLERVGWKSLKRKYYYKI
jgi:hypothetical protein